MKTNTKNTPYGPIGSQSLAPYSQDAEVGVIGCCLHDSSISLEFKGAGCRAEWFHHGPARLAWEAMEHCMKNGLPIGETILVETLQGLGTLESVGGHAEVNRWANKVESTVQAKHWLEIVRKNWLQRSALILATMALERLREPTTDSGEIRQRLMGTILEMSELAANSTPKGEKVIASQAADGLERILNGEEACASNRLVSHGLDYLDNHIPFLTSKSPTTEGIGEWKPGEMIVLAARPSVGKTSLMLQACAKALFADHKKQKVAIYSLEMSMEDILRRLAAIDARCPLEDSDDFRSWAARSSENEEAVAWLRESMMIIVEAAGKRLFFKGGGISLEEIVSHARWAHQQCGGLNLIAVDYAQLVDVSEKSNSWKGMSRQEVVAKTTRTLKVLAMELECVVLLLSQFNRDADDEAGPKLTQLRESGAIEQDADIVLALWQPPTDANGSAIGSKRIVKPLKLRVLKNRRGERDFDLWLFFEPQMKTFTGVPSGESRGRPRKGMTGAESREALRREREAEGRS